MRDAEDVTEASADHLRDAARDGRIRALITVFAPDAHGRSGPRIWNEQLIRYPGDRLLPSAQRLPELGLSGRGPHR